MNEKLIRVTENAANERQKVLRARSVQHAVPFRVATFHWSLYCLGMVVSLTALAAFFIDRNALLLRIMTGGMLFSGLMWLFAFFKRRAAKCPLCKGTPLLNSGAVPHVRARRIGPLNHGVSAMLSIMARQRFRCMYCGTDYDLLKPRTRRPYADTRHDGNSAHST